MMGAILWSTHRSDITQQIGSRQGVQSCLLASEIPKDRANVALPGVRKQQLGVYSRSCPATHLWPPREHSMNFAPRPSIQVDTQVVSP